MVVQTETPARERFAGEEARWQALRRRDPAADGAFLYSVRTTGVYCRPSCPSRPAKRENVAFHDTRLEAERAGFRPCKRCRPDQASLAERHAAAIERACRLIEAAEEEPDLATLAESVGMSRYHFHRVFKATTGVTPKDYAHAMRGARVREQLEGSASVTRAIYDAGFNSSGRFYARADQMLGMTPSTYRKGAPDTRIRFGVGECSLGSILVAASDKGICAILMGDDPDALARELQDRFPEADLHGDDGELEAWMARVIGFVDDPSIGLELPLDVRGTAFQQRVWRALTHIPVGSTLSYSELAAEIGAPGSARAVAGACAANRIAVAIPCHRVVRTDGRLSGYRWGVARKRALLKREAEI